MAGWCERAEERAIERRRPDQTNVWDFETAARACLWREGWSFPRRLAAFDVGADV